MSEQYDNSYNGALFATRDPETLAGPFQLSNVDAKRLRTVCTLKDDGKHHLAVYAERADGKGLKAKPVATGFIKRYRSRNEKSPVAKGVLRGKERTVPLAIWHVTAGDGTPCYQIKPDRLSSETTELPEL